MSIVIRAAYEVRLLNESLSVDRLGMSAYAGGNDPDKELTETSKVINFGSVDHEGGSVPAHSLTGSVS